MRVPDKTRAVFGQVVLARLAPGYVSRAVIGSTEERNAVRISRLWGGVLRDDPKKGCVGDYDVRVQHALCS